MRFSDANIQHVKQGVWTDATSAPTPTDLPTHIHVDLRRTDTARRPGCGAAVPTRRSAGVQGARLTALEEAFKGTFGLGSAPVAGTASAT